MQQTSFGTEAMNVPMVLECSFSHERGDNIITHRWSCERQEQNI